MSEAQNNALQEVSSQPAAGSGDLMVVEEQRAIAEVKAALQLAKMFPRNLNESYTRIMESCRRKSLAEHAIYTYPRGSTRVEGPSIRLAEAMAQAWGNLQFGIRELSQGRSESTVEAFAWDVETNTRQVKTFQVKHKRYTKSGSYDLTDPRDIYEMVANQGARRMRACILGIIPGDVLDSALEEVKKTLQSGNDEPLADRIRKMVDAFKKDYQVSAEMLESYLGHKLEAVTESQMVTLKGIYRSLKDGVAQRADFFDVPDDTSRTDSMKDKLAGDEETKKRGPGRPRKEDQEPPVDDPAEKLELPSTFALATCEQRLQKALELGGISAMDEVMAAIRRQYEGAVAEDVFQPVQDEYERLRN